MEERMFDVMVYIKSGKSFVNIFSMKEETVFNMQNILANKGRIDVQIGENQLVSIRSESIDYMVITEVFEEEV